ncbi:MAG: DUF262 domain-containing protein [Candidatus Methanoperedens sp.]
MNLPEPHTLSFSTLISEIDKGIIKIPQFQRDFVWNKKRSCRLMDSIVKGYPIGTFIFWKTNERLRAIKNIGGIELPEASKGEFIQYVLDGQQRLTSLYATLKGLGIQRDGIQEDFSEMYIDLEVEENDDVVIFNIENNDKSKLIKLNDLLFGSFQLLNDYPKEFHNKIDEYRKRIQSYNFSVILIKEASIDVATDIFTRINVGGKPLSVFEIMVAKTFDSEKNFDLAEKYQELIENISEIDYETIADATVLQTVSTLLTKECSKKQILNLKKQNFIDIWDEAEDSIVRAVEYFRNFYRIPVSQLLPYNALVVPFAYFFYHHKDKPTGDKQRYLQDFFWRSSLSGRYSSSLESKLAQDIKRIDKILKDDLPRYDYAIDTSPEFIQNNGFFSANKSYIKSILCIYAYQQPKSFIDNSTVQIGNDWLKRANSKNYHHFFPKSYLEKNGEDYFYINHILNITIVDDFLNKKEIKTKPPAIYMKKFSKENPDIDKTMKTHLIDNLNKFGIWENDYDIFFEMRAEKVSQEIRKRIIPQEIDSKGQEPIQDINEEDLES